MDLIRGFKVINTKDSISIDVACIAFYGWASQEPDNTRFTDRGGRLVSLVLVEESERHGGCGEA